jgi:hypothetical protein
MPYAVFVTTPRAGLGFAVSPYTVELAQQYETREEAQAVADAQQLPPAVIALFDAMPPIHPAWTGDGTYAIGDFRSFDGRTWRCIQGHTAISVWEPPAVPALWVVVENPGATAWGWPVTYTLPAQRTYNGRLYELLQEHTSQAQWNPPEVPALWKDLGPALGVPAYSRARWDVVDTASPDYSEIERAVEA